MSASSASSSGSELTDYDSSSSLEVFVSPRKLKEELKKELEKEKKAAAEQGLPTYGDGTRQKFDKKGRLRNEQIVRLERINKKRRSMRAQVMRNIALHLHRPSVRQAYNFFTREIPPENDLNSGLTKRKIRVTADEDSMRVTIIRSPPLPY